MSFVFLMSNNSYSSLSSFIFELGLLNNFKRSGFDFLGTGNQNISSHLYRTSIIGYILAKRVEGADPLKVLLICMFHDIPESRTGDINYFQKKYVSKDEDKAVNDIISMIPEFSELKEYVDLFNQGSCINSQIAQDADCLELIATLKEEQDKGNMQAKLWIESSLSRLKLKESISLSKEMLKVNSYDWWMKILNLQVNNK